MNWTQQFEDMMKNWTDMQKKVWDNFFETMGGLGKSQSSKAWEHTVSVGEDALKNMFKTQAEWIGAWIEGLSAIEGMPEAALQAARQFQEMAKRWNTTQEELWANWFKMVKNFDPARMATGWSEPPDLFKTFQETTQKIIETQTEWMRSWMGGIKKEPGE